MIPATYNVTAKQTINNVEYTTSFENLSIQEVNNLGNQYRIIDNTKTDAIYTQKEINENWLNVFGD